MSFKDKILWPAKRKYASLLANHPILVIFVAMGIPLALSAYAILYGNFVLDTGFDSFKVEGFKETDNNVAYYLAKENALNTRKYLYSKKEEKKRLLAAMESDEGKDLERRNKLLDVAVFFRVEANKTSSPNQQYTTEFPPLENNVLTISRLLAIQQIHKAIVGNTTFSSLCLKPKKKLNTTECEISKGVLDFVFFSKDEVGTPIFDGKGPLETNEKLIRSLEYLTGDGTKNQGGYALFDRNFTVDNLKSSTTVILYSFGCPLAGFSSCIDRKDDQYAIIAKFMKEEVKPIFKNSILISNNLAAVYGSQFLLDSIVKLIIKDDVLYALGSFCFILTFMTLYIGSFILAFLGLLHILVAFPASYYVFHVLLGASKVNVMNTLSIFVIMGIGADDIFVMVDCWKLSKKFHIKAEERMIYVLEHAVASTLLTSFTTGAAFASNMISSVPPIREFGIFMALLVIWNYVLSITYFPASLRLYQLIAKSHLYRKFNTFIGLKKNIDRDEFEVLGNINWKHKVAHFFYGTFAKSIIKWRNVIILAFCGLLIMCGIVASGLKQSTSEASFLPDNHDIMKSHNIWKKVMRTSAEGSLLSNDIPGVGPVKKYSFYSNSLQSKKRIEVYLPPYYNTWTPYPVMYFLHGFFQNESSFPELYKQLDYAINNQIIPPLIVAKPDSSIVPLAGTMYANSKLYGQYADYITKDVVDHIDETYRTIKRAESRVIFGHSLGGYGAFKLALERPDIFSISIAHSPPTNFNLSNSKLHEEFLLHLDYEYEQNPDKKKYDPAAGMFSTIMYSEAGVFSPNVRKIPYPVDLPLHKDGSVNEPVSIKWAKYSLSSIMEVEARKNETIRNLQKEVKFYSDCGVYDEMGHFSQNNFLARKMKEHNLQHAYETFIGGHTDNIVERLRHSMVFISKHLNTKLEQHPSEKPKLIDGCVRPCVHGKCLPTGKCAFKRANKKYDLTKETCSDYVPCRTKESIPGVCIRSHECQCSEKYYGRSCSAEINPTVKKDLPLWALADIKFIYGIKELKTKDKKNIFSLRDRAQTVIYDGEIDFELPEIQQKLLDVCTYLTRPTPLIRRRYRCSIQSFKDWRIANNKSFPILTKNATKILAYFVGIQDRIFDDTIKFMNVSVGQPLKVAYIQFKVTSYFDKSASSKEALIVFKKWEAYVRELNMAVGLVGFQVSDVWVRMRLELTAASESQVSIAVSLLCALLSILLFTRNVFLSIYCFLVIGGIILSMFAFFVATGWTLGAIEAISLSVIVGLSVDYSAHIVHAFNHDYGDRQLTEGSGNIRKKSRKDMKWVENNVDILEIQGDSVDAFEEDKMVVEIDPFQKESVAKAIDGKERVRLALESIGISIVAGAISTAGASSFLLFCTITILLLFGMIVLANTLVSMAFSMLLLPSSLSYVNSQDIWKWMKKENNAHENETSTPQPDDSLVDKLSQKEGEKKEFEMVVI